MTIHQCPKCELRYERKTELDDHCWHDHPEFRHEYPAHARPDPEPHQHAPAEPLEPKHITGASFLGWLLPDHSPSSTEPTQDRDAG